MVENFKHTTSPKCKFNDSGYCKFGNYCRKRHFLEICPKLNCKINTCKARHPKLCKHEENCKFFKQGICAYKHVTLAKHDEQLKGLKSEIDILKSENMALIDKIRKIEILYSEELSNTERLKSEIEDLEQSIKVKVELIGKFQQEDLEKFKEKTFPCKKCNFTFESKTGFEKHLKGIQHNTDVSDNSFNEEEDDDDADEEFKEKCYFCQKIFLSYDSLDDHQSNYIRCEKCVVCYHNEFEYEKHEHCDF